MLKLRRRSVPRLTLFGRSLLLLSSELLANAVCWTVAGILFGRRKETQPILSLALLAWTIGLRHALDADHISAIDNATRTLISLGQLPVTCGLFFSLGHSTIVIVVNVAIAISTTVYDRIDGVGRVGGIVGAAVSGSFLFIVGLANSIILWRVLSKRRRLKKARKLGQPVNEFDEEESNNNTLMMKIIGPIVTFVNKPWKMYPVGVLFGFGFDTASSIALLAVSAIARKGADGSHIASGDIVILPLLFTAGMTLIDSLDSILMLYSYAGFPERSFAIFESSSFSPSSSPSIPHPGGIATTTSPSPTAPSGTSEMEETPKSPEVQVECEEVRVVDPNDSKKDRNIMMTKSPIDETEGEYPDVDVDEEKRRAIRMRELQVRRNAMSGLSVLLTFMSILVAFSISLITIMGLIGDNCTSCQKAANAEDGGGLAGRWWRGWANANDNSGYIGAAIVASFIFVVSCWYGLRWAWRKWGVARGRAHKSGESNSNKVLEEARVEQA